MTEDQIYCRAMATLQKRWPENYGTWPDLRLVGKSLPPPTPAETFHEASLSIGDFAQRWRDGSVTVLEVENADVLLVGLRRLLADARAV